LEYSPFDAQSQNVLKKNKNKNKNKQTNKQTNNFQIPSKPEM
jgi:hypothetical protein